VSHKDALIRPTPSSRRCHLSQREAMQANGALGDRHHCTALDLVSEPFEDLADQCGNVGTAEALAPDANHGRSARAADGQQPMKVRIQGHDRVVLIERQRSDFGIARAGVPNVGDVAQVETARFQVSNSAARQALIQQQSDHAGPRVTI